MIYHNVEPVADRYYILNKDNEFVYDKGFGELTTAIHFAEDIARSYQPWNDDVLYIQITEQHGTDQYGKPKVDVMCAEYVIQVNNGKVDDCYTVDETIRTKPEKTVQYKFRVKKKKIRPRMYLRRCNVEYCVQYLMDGVWKDFNDYTVHENLDDARLHYRYDRLHAYDGQRIVRRVDYPIECIAPGMPIPSKTWNWR